MSNLVGNPKDRFFFHDMAQVIQSIYNFFTFCEVYLQYVNVYHKPKFQTSCYPLSLYSLVVGTLENRFSHDTAYLSLVFKKLAFCIYENKPADQLRSYFVFAKRILQSLYYLNLIFQASCHPQWLYSLVCVGPGRKPQRQGLS